MGGREDGRERQEEGERTTAWPTSSRFLGPIWGIWSTKHFFECGGLLATVARELFSNNLTHLHLRSFDLFRAPAGFCWTVR